MGALPAWLKNENHQFKYLRIEGKTKSGAGLKVVFPTGTGERTVCLSMQMIRSRQIIIYTELQKISLPGWLAEKTGVLDDAE